MKSMYLLATFMFITVSMNAQDFIYFDKKFKRVKNPASARYLTNIPNPDKPHRIVNQSSGRVYAEGVIHEADTLSFDGKVTFYNDDRTLKAIRFYKKGIEMPRFPVDFKLNKLAIQPNNTNTFYLTADDNGEFAAYQKSKTYDDRFEEFMIATGKIVDTFGLVLDDIVTTYGKNAEVKSLTRFNRGVEVPFIATTTDIKEPYDIIRIVSYSAINYEDVDAALETFKMRCKLVGADGAIGINSSFSTVPLSDNDHPNWRNQIFIQGTAIKLKKKE